MTMPFGTRYKNGRRQGDIPVYYEQDAGCVYSNGIGCLQCPFVECVDDLGRGRRRRFGLDWDRDRAQAWRIEQKPREHEGEL